MAITAITGIKEADYISLMDTDDENKTTWKLRPLNGMQYMEVIAELKSDEDGDRLSGKGLALCIKYGLVGWDNFTDENGKVMKFNRLNISKIPPVILTELAGEIITNSEVGGEQIKN